MTTSDLILHAVYERRGPSTYSQAAAAAGISGALAAGLLLGHVTGGLAVENPDGTFSLTGAGEGRVREQRGLPVLGGDLQVA